MQQARCSSGVHVHGGGAGRERRAAETGSWWKGGMGGGGGGGCGRGDGTYQCRLVSFPTVGI